MNGSTFEPWQKQYIETNAGEKSITEMAKATDLSYSSVYQYCIHRALPIKNGRMGRPKGVKNHERVPTDAPPSEVSKRIRKYVTNEEFTNSRNSSGMVRPPAKYNNRSQQEIIDYYLKLEI